MDAITIEPLSPILGARVHGVDLARALDAATFGGMDDRAGLLLLDQPKAHATGPEYLHTYDYRAGEVIVWDNAQLLHKAPLTDPGDPRTLWRVTIKEEA